MDQNTTNATRAKMTEAVAMATGSKKVISMPRRMNSARGKDKSAMNTSWAHATFGRLVLKMSAREGILHFYFVAGAQ